MKKNLALALAMMMALSMTACGSKTETAAPAATEAAPAATEAAAAETEAPAEAAETEAAEAGEAAEAADPTDYAAIAMEGKQTTIECEPIELTFACSGTLDGTIGGDAVSTGIQAVSDWTGGNFKVNFYQGGQLGGDVELIEGVQMGTVDLYMGAPSSQITLLPEVAVMDIAGLYTDVDSCNAVIESFKDQFQTVYNAKGLRLMEMFSQDFRILSSNKPVETAADLQGLNIRTQENAYHMTFWKALGANPTPLAFSELYIALQQGMLDAQENPPASIVGAKICEVQKYIVKTNHIPFVMTFVGSQSKYDSMSDGQKLAYEQFCDYLKKYILAGQAADDERLLKICEDEYGIQVTEVSEEVRAQFAAASQAVIDQMKSEGKIDAAFIDAYVAATGFVAP